MSVYCSDWSEILSSPDCVRQSLVLNSWADPASLDPLEDSELKNLLIKKLNFYLSSDLHSVVDLTMRDLTGDKGSLCGLAAFYRAGQETLLTVFHLKQLSYEDIRTLLSAEMDNQAIATMTDLDFLLEFNKCKFSIFILEKYPVFCFLTGKAGKVYSCIGRKKGFGVVGVNGGIFDYMST